MSNLYNNFENRFTNNWFSASWIDIETKPQILNSHKSLLLLQEELRNIQEYIENISQKQLQLSNLAKFYPSASGLN